VANPLLDEITAPSHFNRHFPDKLQIRSNHTHMAPPLEHLPQESDGLILVIWRSSEIQLAKSVVIQTHLSRHFHLAVDFLGLRRNGSSP
jgi:hypothetical protein